MLTRGQAMAQRQAQMRKRMEPKAFGYAGKLYDCTSKSLDADARGVLIDDGGGNATSADQRLVSLSPVDFTHAAALTPPAEGADCTYQGDPYFVKKVLTCEMAYGAKVNLPVIIYRRPPPNTVTGEAAPPPTGAVPPPVMPNVPPPAKTTQDNIWKDREPT